LTDFDFLTSRETNSITQKNRYTAAWAAPEILEGIETITRETDVFAFGMVMIEVCPCALPHLVLEVEGGWFT